MKQVVTDFYGPKLFRSWVRENPLWWCLFRTDDPGGWSAKDIAEFRLCKIKYLVYFDHSLESKAKEMAIYLLDRFEFFKAAKVSKYARDGEKVLVLLGRDASLMDSLGEFVKHWNMLLFKTKNIDEQTEHDRQAEGLRSAYLMRLAKAHMPDA